MSLTAQFFHKHLISLALFPRQRKPMKMAMEQLNSMLLEMPALKFAVLVFQIYMRIILM